MNNIFGNFEIEIGFYQFITSKILITVNYQQICVDIMHYYLANNINFLLYKIL